MDPTAGKRLSRAIALTRLGMTAERAARAFWPLWTILLLILAALFFGAQDALPLEAAWAVAVICALALIGTATWGLWRFRLPRPGEAEARLDASLSGRPLAAMDDLPATGADDPTTRALWAAHQRRMAERLAGARAVPGDLRVSSRDPYALRYVALLAFAAALLFGSVLRVGSVAELAPGSGPSALASGPAWEGWVEPPAYTGRPSLYLADIPPGRLEVPQGSRVIVRLYGEVGDLYVSESVSAEGEAQPAATGGSQELTVARSGRLSIEGEGGAAWDVLMLPDMVPDVDLGGDAERTPEGETRIPFSARDDHGIIGGTATVSLDMDRVERRYGLTLEPEPREPVVLDLPLPISGDRADFDEVLIADLARHPFAGLPVTITVTVEDALGQEAVPSVLRTELQTRRFFDPLARAIVEMRRDILWNAENGRRASQILRAVSYRPEDNFDSEVTYLRLRYALRRLESNLIIGLRPGARDEIAEMLWDVAVLIEDGRFADALERLRQAQDRLEEAMREGATDEEIAELMQELQEAMDEYMRQLAQQEPEGGQQQAQGGESQEITQDQLQEMLDRIQELMEQGRMEEAQAMLDQLRQMMENMQVAEGQGGQGQQGPGEQAMEDLAETLREQQGLSDEAFRDLQEQFGQEGAGRSDQNRGRSGQDGQGVEHGADSQGQSQGSNPDAPRAQGGGEQSLADRQEALRRELERQRGSLPGAGTEEGDAAREALERADRAMEGAEDALRQGDNAEAIDRQAEAMDALREGMQGLAEQMAEAQRQEGGGEQGQQMGSADPLARDPLGREAGSRGSIGSDEALAEGEDVYRRARDILDEIRRRSADRTRPEEEREYLERLLDRF